MVIQSGRRDLEMEMMKNSPRLVLPKKKRTRSINRTWTPWKPLMMLAHVASLELERLEEEEAMKKKMVDVPALIPLLHDHEEEEEATKKKKKGVPALPFSCKKVDVPPALPLMLHNHAEEKEATKKKKKNDHPALLLSCKKKKMDHDDDSSSSKKAVNKKRKKIDHDDSSKKAMEKKKRRTKKAQYDPEPAPHGWLEAHHRMMVANKDPGLIDVFRKTLESSDVSSHLNRFYLPKEKVREKLLPGLGFSQDFEEGSLKEGKDVVGLDDMGRQWNLCWNYWSHRYHILDGQWKDLVKLNGWQPHLHTIHVSAFLYHNTNICFVLHSEATPECIAKKHQDAKLKREVNKLKRLQEKEEDEKKKTNN